MATQVQNRRGSTAEHSTFTGAVAELTVDTDKDVVVVHDGSTAGGHPMLKQDLSNLPAGTIDNADINSSAAIAGTKISPNFGSQNVTTNGTATAAALIPSGSSVPTNGVYLPSANNVAISTNGTGRLFVDANGNVGIGTSVSSLSFASGSGTLLYGADVTRFVIKNATTGAGQYAGVEMNAGSDGSFNFIQWQNQPTVWLTNNGSSVSERMRLDSSGRLGLGTSSPGYGLDVIRNDTYQLRLASSTSNYASGGLYLGAAGTGDPYYYGYVRWNQSATTLDIAAQDGSGAGGLRFLTNGGSTSPTERVRIDVSGRVGIGTATVDERLHVVGNIKGVDSSGQGVQIINTTTPYIQALGTSTINDLQIKAKTIQFETGTTYSTSQRVQIDSSGRLLVGTSTSVNNALDAGLQVVGTGADAYFSITRYDSIASAPAGIILGRSKSGTKGTNTAVADGDFLGIIEFTGADGGSSFRSAASVAAYVDGAVTGGGAADMPGRLVFSTTADGASSPTERMRITNAGNMLVGTSTSRGRITSEPAAGDWGLGVNDVNASTQSFAAFRYSGTLIGSITGNNTATAYNTSSDYRLKENVVPLTGAIDRVNQLQVHRFNFIADPDKTVDGFIAHEAQAVVPECVTGTKDEVDVDGNPIYQGIDQSKLVPLLTAALQEALAEIESLKTRLTAAGI